MTTPTSINSDEEISVKRLHPNSEYYMRDEIGPLIAHGLGMVYKEQPRNPVDFFAKWLLLENWKRKEAEKDKKKDLLRQKKKAQDDYYRVCVERILAKKKFDKEVMNQKIIDFR
jgi:hypothetical protein